MGDWKRNRLFVKKVLMNFVLETFSIGIGGKAKK